MNYKPINCSFHDLLLDRASRKVISEIVYTAEEKRNTYRGKIVDVFSSKGEEFLEGEKEFVIRLDQIVSLDGILRF